IYGDCHEPRQIATRAFGRPFGEFEGRVVDEHDREVPHGTEGELVVRCAGPDPRRGFFSGYLKNPEATEQAWRGGWFHTGDVVRQAEGDKLAYFKAPGWFLFVSSLPTTGTQKVQKTQIFPRGEDPRRRPGAVDLRARKKRR